MTPESDRVQEELLCFFKVKLVQNIYFLTFGLDM